MRRSLFALFFTSALLSVTACQGEKKDLLALPAAYNPKHADLTFNKKNLEAFNLMNEAGRKAHIKALKAAGVGVVITRHASSSKTP